MTVYYADKIDRLRRLFGTKDVALDSSHLRVGVARYPIVDDVIVCLDPVHWPPALKQRLDGAGDAAGWTDHGQTGGSIAADIQASFGAEWTEYSEILPEHAAEFELYFDLVDMSELNGALVCDLGCGIGRWSHFLAPHVSGIVLVDFSDAIFVARRNLADQKHAILVMADIGALPFVPDGVDFMFSLGVLHHLPTDCLQTLRALAPLSPRLLIYLYYALDNRQVHFRLLLAGVTAVRGVLSRIRSEPLRATLTWIIALGVYKPLVWLGHGADLVGQGASVPLYEGYKGKGLRRIRQDVYDRFFTGIEQRVSVDEIRSLEDHFERVTISDRLPYWHFLCEGRRSG